MKLLGIETASTHASVALAVAGNVYVAAEQTLKKHAEWVLEAIAGLLTQAEGELTDLDGIAFDAGPGSFTGLRIACAVAKGLAMGASLPLYPVCSLRAIASDVQKHTHVLAVIDARMHAWYWGYFEAGKQKGEIRVTSPQEIICDDASPLWLAGVGFEALQAELPPPMQSRLVGTQMLHPTAQQLLQVVELGEIKPVNPVEATPFYVRQQVTQQGDKNG